MTSAFLKSNPAKLFAVTVLVMVAFAANSVLNRMAITFGGVDAMQFASVRVVSGALALAVIVLLRDRRLLLRGPYRAIGVGSLLVYLVGFSLAYVRLDAGVGALILFGVVQVTMFGGAVISRETIPRLRWFGAGAAFAGLIWLLWPGGGVEISILHSWLMVLAGIGWGIYSLAGRKSGDPLAATAANFILAAPICLALQVVVQASSSHAIVSMTPGGLSLAVVSGVVTSALGYTLWFAVLPRLQASVAAVSQLTVPVIAMVGGLIILGETVSLALILACALVLGGVFVSVIAPRR